MPNVQTHPGLWHVALVLLLQIAFALVLPHKRKHKRIQPNQYLNGLLYHGPKFASGPVSGNVGAPSAPWLDSGGAVLTIHS